MVGATGLEPAISCSQSRRASHYATPRIPSDSIAGIDRMSLVSRPSGDQLPRR